VLASPTIVLDRHAEHLTGVLRELRRVLTWRLDAARAELDRLRSQCVALSPAATLRRGYAVVRDDAGHVLRDGAAVPVGSAVEILLAQGRLEADVTRAHPGAPFRPQPATQNPADQTPGG